MITILLFVATGCFLVGFGLSVYAYIERGREIDRERLKIIFLQEELTEEIELRKLAEACLYSAMGEIAALKDTVPTDEEIRQAHQSINQSLRPEP